MSPEIRLTIEPFSAWRREAEPLFRAHWEEIARHREQVPLDPDWQRYQALEDGGVLFAVTMRRAWRLVGYLTYLVAPHLHYRSLVVGAQDMIYVAPEHRRGGFGYCALVRFGDEALRERGVHLTFQRDKAAYPLEAVYRRLHYAPAIERTHERVLQWPSI